MRRAGRLLQSTDRLDVAAEALGRRLAGLHHRVGEPARVPAAPRPWPLRGTHALDAVPLGALGHRIALASGERGIRMAVQAAVADWNGQAIRIHGDLGPWSVVVRHARGEATVTLLDRGSVGVGHPAWDVVSVLELLGDVDGRPRERAAAQRRFLTAYTQEGGTGSYPSPAWGCVRALVTAQVRAVRGDEAGVVKRLQRARVAASTLEQSAA